MNLGNKIVDLRKKNSLSQEELAEKVGVTRQTISKWELEETTPDINQAKKLSQIFKVSLDELTDNDVNAILVEKVSNTEKLAGMIITILKIFGVFIVGFIILIILAFILFNANSSNNKIVGKYSIMCTLDGEEYRYEWEYNENHQAIYAGGDGWISNHTDVDKYENVNKAIAHVEDWFKDHNGKCLVNKDDYYKLVE